MTGARGADDGRAAHAEHSIVLTVDGPVVLTVS
jgi:hypothetical protein